MRPAHGLLVDQFYCRVGPGLAPQSSASGVKSSQDLSRLVALLSSSASFSLLMSLGSRCTYLQFHNRLLEPRPRHRSLTWHLTPTPCSFSIWRLHNALLLPFFLALLQRARFDPLHADGSFVGDGDIRRILRRLGIISRHEVRVADCGGCG